MRKSCDYAILFATLILVAFGTVMVFSASFYAAQNTANISDAYYFFRKQVFGAVLGLGAMIFMMNFKYTFIKKFKWPAALVSIVLLTLVLFMGTDANGATRWLNIAGFSVQPSEIAKLGLVVFMAAHMDSNKEAIRPFMSKSGRKHIRRDSAGKAEFRRFLIVLLPMLAVMGIMAVLILEQPNMSTAVNLVLVAMVMMFVGGISIVYLSGFTVVGAIGVVVLAFAESYRVKRMLSFTNPWADPQDTGYQLIQSLLALGSGGFGGVGFGQSSQKYLWLPYRESDFIYAIIGEELGFIGGVLLLTLYLFVIWRGIKVAFAAPDMFGMLLAIGITAVLSIQVILNVAVVTGLMPTTGLPLPFISYGSSSLVISMASMGILLNISRYSKAAT